MPAHDERKERLYNELSNHFGVEKRVIQKWIKDFKDKGIVNKKMRTPFGRYIAKTYSEYFPDFDEKIRLTLAS
jgi:hypothetical protein